MAIDRHMLIDQPVSAFGLGLLKESQHWFFAHPTEAQLMPHEDHRPQATNAAKGRIMLGQPQEFRFDIRFWMEIFISVKAKHPIDIMGQNRQSPIDLIGVRHPRMLMRDRASRLCFRDCLIGGQAVDHMYLIDFPF